MRKAIKKVENAHTFWEAESRQSTKIWYTVSFKDNKKNVEDRNENVVTEPDT